MQHLGDKLHAVADEVGIEIVPLTDDTVVDILEGGERTLCEMQARIRLFNDADLDRPDQIVQLTAKQQLQPTGEDILGHDDTGTLHLRPFNQRIDLSGTVDDMNNNRSSDYDDTHDLDDDELTREKVKRAASQVLVQQEKKQKAIKKKANQRMQE
jgi:hypothetical protein